MDLRNIPITLTKDEQKNQGVNWDFNNLSDPTPGYQDVTSNGVVNRGAMSSIANTTPLMFVQPTQDTSAPFQVQNNAPVAAPVANTQVKAPVVNSGIPAASATPTDLGISGNVGQVAYTPAELEQQKAEQLKNQYYQDEAAPVTEEERRRAVTADFQQEIDNLNQIYATNRAEATRLGQGRLGQDTAIQARRGLIGSSFGEAATTGVEQFNTGEMNKVDAEHAAKMNVLQAQFRAAITKSREDKKAAQKLGADYYAEYTKQKPARDAALATKQVQAAIAAKVKPSDKELEDWASSIGVDPVRFKQEFADAQKLATNTDTKTALDQKKLVSDLETQALNRMKTGVDINKPYEVGGYLYQYNPMTGQAQQVGDARSVSSSGDNTTAAEVKQFINTQMATQEFKDMSDEDKKDFILSNGGTPSDYDL